MTTTVTPDIPTGTRTVYVTTTLYATSGYTDGNSDNGPSTTSTSTLSQTTSTRTVTTATTTRTSTSRPTQPWPDNANSPANLPRFSTCNPGDEDYEEPGVLSLTKEQKVTLAAIAIMFAVILIGWNFVVLRYLLYPLKVGTVAASFDQRLLTSSGVDREHAAEHE